MSIQGVGTSSSTEKPAQTASDGNDLTESPSMLDRLRNAVGRLDTLAATPDTPEQPEVDLTGGSAPQATAPQATAPQVSPPHAPVYANAQQFTPRFNLPSSSSAITALQVDPPVGPDNIVVNSATGNPVRIFESVDDDGSTTVQVTDSRFNVLGEYATGSVVNLEVDADVTQVHVDRDTDVTVNIVLGDNNQFLDVDGGNSDINVTGNDQSNDINVSTDGDVVVDSGDGADRVVIDSAVNATIRAGAGNDTVDVQATEQARIFGGAGNNSVTVSDASHARVFTGVGDDSITILSVDDVTVGTGNGADVVTVTDATMVKVNAGNDNDNISIAAADSVDINAGAGNDTVIVTASLDATIDAGAGNDDVDTYGTESTTIYGGLGRDYIRTGNGRDTIYGGSGDDTIYAGDGKDTIHGEGGRDYIDGGRDDDRIFGGESDDILAGNQGNDVIRGQGGDDVLIAGAGRDSLTGGTGNDTAYHQVDDLVTSRYADRSIENHSDPEFISDIPDDFDPGDLQRINVGSDESNNFRDRVHDDLATLRSVPVTARGLELIENATSGSGAEHDITIYEFAEQNGRARAEDTVINLPIIGPIDEDVRLQEDADGDGRLDANDGADGLVRYNPNFDLDATTNVPNDRNMPPIGILYHELAHNYDYITGQLEPGDYQGPDAADVGVGNRERDAVGIGIEREDGTTDSHHPEELTENAIRTAFGLPNRVTYR